MLVQAKKKLDILQLPDEERRAYESFEQDLHQRASMVESHYGKGKREGLKEGRAEGRAEGLAEGETKGRAEGLAEGETKGRAAGLVDGQRAALQTLLVARFGPLLPTLKERIETSSLDDVNKALLRVVEASSIEDVFD